MVPYSQSDLPSGGDHLRLQHFLVLVRIPERGGTCRIAVQHSPLYPPGYYGRGLDRHSLGLYPPARRGVLSVCDAIQQSTYGMAGGVARFWRRRIFLL